MSVNPEQVSLLTSRRSVRAFLPEPLSEEILQSIFQAAQQAPSNCNTQPWQVCVLSGDAIERMRKKYGQTWLEGKVSMDFPFSGVYEGVFRERQFEAGAELYRALGIDRKDKVARNEHFMDNMKFFGAPHVAFVFIPEQFGMREAADVGMYAQSLMLSMNAHGVACCPQTILSFCADMVREELKLDNSLKLLFGISFGYEDEKESVNNCRIPRAPLDQCIHFYRE